MFLKECGLFVAMSLLLLAFMLTSSTLVEVWKIGLLVLALGLVVAFMMLFEVKYIPPHFLWATAVAGTIFAFAEAERGYLGVCIVLLCFLALRLIPERKMH